MPEGVEKRNEGQRIGRVGKQSEVYDELVFSACLQIISGFGLPIPHGVFFHAHECGIRIGLGIGITFSKDIKVIVVFHQLVTIPFKFPDLFLFLPQGFLFFLVLCCRPVFQGFFKFIRYAREHGGSELHGCVFYGVLLCNGFIHLLQKDADLIHQPCTVPFDCLAPDKSIFVGLGLDLGTVDILHVKTDETFVGKDKNQLREYVVYFLLYTVTKTVDGNKIRMLITGKPDIMDVTQKKLLDFTAGIDIVHVSVDNDLEHHLRMIG